MFIRDTGPVGVLPTQDQRFWCPSSDIAFGFDLATPSLFLKQNHQNLNVVSGKQAAFCAGLKNMATGNISNHQTNFNSQRPMPQQVQFRPGEFDQSMVWFQNMADPNEAFHAQPGIGHPAAPDNFTLAQTQGSQQVPLQSSKRSKHRKTNAPSHTTQRSSSVGFKTELGTNPWNATTNSTNVNQSFSHSINVQGPQNWPHVPNFSNGYIDPFNYPDLLADILPTYGNTQPVAPSFGLGPGLGGIPNVGSSSSSSCRVNSSSPNTVFGSFSSSIGPADFMDMDVAEECFHSPSAFPTDVSVPQAPGAIPQAIFSQPAAPNYGRIPGFVIPEGETVSPKMLHIKKEPGLPSSSSSESLPNPFHMDSDSEAASTTSGRHQEVVSSFPQQSHQSGSKLNASGRKQLPDKAPHPKTTVPSNGPKRRHGSETAGDKAPAPSSKKSKSRTKVLPSAKPQPKTQSQPATHDHHHHHHHHHISTGQSNQQPKDKHSKTSIIASSSKAASSSGTKNAAAEQSFATPRSEQDEFLVQSKLAGMTYKEIRKNGGFIEAESTLRGRFRTLTKPKEARVRKPEFKEIDDKLLKQAVLKFTKNVDEITRDNVPWKLVAEYMDKNGGSYLFGYTTVRKRWEYLMATSDEQVKKDRQASREST